MSKSQRFMEYFLSHRNATNDLVAKIDSEHYTYKPAPTSMETQELINHILKTTFTVISFAAKKSPEELFSDDDPATLTERAQVYTERTKLLIESLSDEDFDDVVDAKEMFGADLPAEQLLQMAMDHEIHHKGQLFVYVRTIGHTDLPLFVKK